MSEKEAEQNKKTDASNESESFRSAESAATDRFRDEVQTSQQSGGGSTEKRSEDRNSQTEQIAAGGGALYRANETSLKSVGDVGASLKDLDGKGGGGKLNGSELKDKFGSMDKLNPSEMKEKFGSMDKLNPSEMKDKFGPMDKMDPKGKLETMDKMPADGKRETMDKMPAEGIKDSIEKVPADSKSETMDKKDPTGKSETMDKKDPTGKSETMDKKDPTGKSETMDKKDPMDKLDPKNEGKNLNELEKKMEDELPAHEELPTGDVIKRDEEGETLTTPNGDQIHLNEDGSHGIEGDVRGVHQEDGVTTVTFGDGATVSFDKEGFLNVQRGNQGVSFGRGGDGGYSNDKGDIGGSRAGVGKGPAHGTGTRSSNDRGGIYEHGTHPNYSKQGLRR